MEKMVVILRKWLRKMISPKMLEVSFILIVAVMIYMFLFILI